MERETREEHEDSEQDFQILAVQISGVKSTVGRDWTIDGKVGTKTVTFKVDTGAQANLLPHSLFIRLKTAAKVRPSKTTLTSYEGNVIEHFGTAALPLRLGNQERQITFFIVKKGKQALLGLSSCEWFGLVKRAHAISSQPSVGEQITEEFPQLFTGLGCVKRPYRITMKDGAKPVAVPARRVPHARQVPLREELERMEAEGIIMKMEEPADWVSPLVIVEKKGGGIRVCMDPRHINENIKRERYELPRREDIEAELAGARWFSKLDANRGFYQIPLDDASSRICTFSTPYGRYRFLRLPFGLSSASEVFQREISDALDRIPGVRVYIDDVLVWGTTKAEHDKRLRAALAAISSAGFTLNAEKCIFGSQEIKFLGDIISSEGIKPDDELVKCVASMPTPTSKQEVRRMLGAVNYFGKYIPCLSEKTAALRSLMCESVCFEWSGIHQKEWEMIRTLLMSAPVLAVFDPHKEIKISTDASRNALGAALMQLHDKGWRPVAYASRALTGTESRYAQIEKEALGITFGCEKFAEFIIGTKIAVETDHQPLLAIAKKELCEMPPRLQRFFLRLMRFELTLQFIPGKKLLLADALSRIPVQDNMRKNEDEDVNVHAAQVLESLVSDKMKARLQAATQQDEELRQVITHLEQGEIIGPFAAVKSELSYVDGILMKGCKVVIPRQFRREMLGRLHEGHLGLNKTKARARLLMYWPGMQKQIEELHAKCSTCCQFAYRQPSEPVISSPAPSFPWERVGIDLCEHSGTSFLVAYDAYSNYPEVERLVQTSSESVIRKLEMMFARHGIPLEIHTDGGPQFTSSAFRNFARVCDFSHVISSPRFPRANGLAEKGVQVVKRLLKKTKHAREAFWVALLNYRLSPQEGGMSPAEMLMGRRLRGRLPDFAVQPAAEVKKHVQKPRAGTSLPVLDRGDTVRILDDFGWTVKATVQDRIGPRSYVLRTEEGRTLRRNRQHIRRTDERFMLRDTEEEYEDNCLARDAGKPQPTEDYPPPSSVVQPGSTRESSDNHAEITPAAENATSSTAVHHPTMMQAMAPEQAGSQANHQGAVDRCNDTGQHVRKSTRNKRPPVRLSYARDFQQIV